MADVTQVLSAMEAGDPEAAERLLSLVYGELRHLAAAHMAREKPGQTLQPTALVHEAWLRLSVNSSPGWENRAHFFAAAAEAMRRILIESARRKQALKRGAGVVRINLDDVDVAATTDSETLLALDEALERLVAEDAESARIVKLRFFAGLTNEETAAAIGLSVRTVKRHWTFARAWLYEHLSAR